MSDDLVKRLRYLAKDIDAYESTAMSQAADRIEQLEAELVRTFNNMMAEAKRVEQLEAALREIAELGFWDGDRAMDIARAVLEGKKDE